MQQLFLVCHHGLKIIAVRLTGSASAVLMALAELRFLGAFMRDKTLWGDKINKVNIIIYVLCALFRN